MLTQGLQKAASSVIEEGSKILDRNNAPAHQAYLQWAEKHQEQALSVLPASRTPDEYRQALNAQLTGNNVNPEDAKALLEDYDLIYTSAVKKFEELSREQVERLKKTANEAGFDLVPVNFLGRWDQPEDEAVEIYFTGEWPAAKYLKGWLNRTDALREFLKVPDFA